MKKSGAMKAMPKAGGKPKGGSHGMTMPKVKGVELAAMRGGVPKHKGGRTRA